MKYTIMDFSQAVMVQAEMDCTDAVLVQYIATFIGSNSMRKVMHGDDVYFWLSYKHVIKDMPILGIKTKDALRRRLRKLVKAGVLGHHTEKTEGTFSCYKLGEVYTKLIYGKDAGSDPKAGGGSDPKAGTKDPPRAKDKSKSTPPPSSGESQPPSQASSLSGAAPSPKPLPEPPAKPKRKASPPPPGAPSDYQQRFAKLYGDIRGGNWKFSEWGRPLKQFVVRHGYVLAIEWFEKWCTDAPLDQYQSVTSFFTRPGQWRPPSASPTVNDAKDWEPS